MDKSVYDMVAATLAELRLPAPTKAVQTLLMRDGYFVGHKFRYDGGHAVWLAGGDTIELYDEQGKLLTAVTVGVEKGAAA